MASPNPIPRASRSWGEGKIFKPSFEDLVRHADLIVLGKVVQIGGIPHTGPSRSRPGSKGYTFWEDSFAILRIERTLKGKAARATVKVAFHSDLEGDLTKYQAGKIYLAFLLRPGKYPDSYTTAHFHFGEYRINDEGKAERVADPSEISKPTSVVLARIEEVLHPPERGR